MGEKPCKGFPHDPAKILEQKRIRQQLRCFPCLPPRGRGTAKWWKEPAARSLFRSSITSSFRIVAHSPSGALRQLPLGGSREKAHNRIVSTNSLPPSEREGDREVVEGACGTFPFSLVYNKRFPHCCALSFRRVAPAFGPGRKHSLLPAWAKNMPPAYFLNASRPLGGSREKRKACEKE